jgi:hypothetical protein
MLGLTYMHLNPLSFLLRRFSLTSQLPGRLPIIYVKKSSLCTVKKVIVFPVPSRDDTSLPGNNLIITGLGEIAWLVTSRLGTGKTITFFLQCGDCVQG